MPKRITSPLFSGMMPTFAIDDGFLDGVEHALVPRLDGDGAGIGRGDGGHIVDGHHRAVGIHQHLVEDVHVGFAGTDVRKGFFEVHHAHFHALFAGGEQLLYV